jgi:hypothetical protein
MLGNEGHARGSGRGGGRGGGRGSGQGRGGSGSSSYRSGPYRNYNTNNTFGHFDDGFGDASYQNYQNQDNGFNNSDEVVDRSSETYRFDQIRAQDAMDDLMGFKRYTEGAPRLGWLINMVPVSLSAWLSIKKHHDAKHDDNYPRQLTIRVLVMVSRHWLKIMSIQRGRLPWTCTFWKKMVDPSK